MKGYGDGFSETISESITLLSESNAHISGPAEMMRDRSQE